MKFHLFDPPARRLWQGHRKAESPYGHTFGSPIRYTGLQAFQGQPRAHVLFRLNLEDPSVPFALPGQRWLPLLCAIRYGACDLGYRVISDNQVKILFQQETKGWKGFPYVGYPARLAIESVTLGERAYEPGDPLQALYWAGIFGYDALTPEQFAGLSATVVQEGLFDPSYMDYETAEQYVLEGNCWPFVQGKPIDDCPDPLCENHAKASSLRMLAIFEEADERVRQLWGASCGGLQIVYQTCPLCGAIRTINQCT